jgi:uncharacterized protein (DUF697 family)/CRP-like cAMP-binding protein
MRLGSLDPAATVQRALEYASSNLTIERLLIQFGIDPNNVTYEAIFNRLLDIALVNITFGNVLALAGGIFLILSFVVRTIVRMRVLCIVSIVFLLGSAVLSGSVPHFFMYLLALPANVVRLVQIRNLVKKARSSEQGTLSLDWLRPFMTPRNHQKGDVLFRKGDAATEMFLTVTGTFLVTEIGIEIPAGRILGELGFLSPNNHRTQSVECIEDGEVLTIAYDKLHEIYLQNPEFGYYFLRLTSDRLLENHARLEKLAAQSKAELAAAIAASGVNLAGSNQAGSTGTNEDKRPKAAALIFKATRVAGVGAYLRQKAGAVMRGAASTDNVIELAPAVSADTEAARQRTRALAIVERHANFSAAGGFIPVPIANMAVVTAVIMRMIRALHELYGMPFEHSRAYGLVIGLTGGVLPTRLSTLATSTVAAFVPGYNLVGLAVSSVTASAYARAVGRMLINDFEHQAALQRKQAAWRRAGRWRTVWARRLAGKDRARSVG